jgi:hypothetical protein
MQRTVGMLAASVLTDVVAHMSRQLFGFDDDDDKALRKTLPEYMREATLYLLGYDENGLMNVIDLNNYDALSYLKKPITALFKGTGDTLTDDVKKAALNIASPIASLKVAYGFTVDVLANKNDRTGKPIYDENDSIADNIADISAYANKTISPGIVKNTMRVIEALDGYDGKGRPIDLGNEVAGFFGFRKTAVNAPMALKYSGYELKEKLVNASKDIKPLLFESGEVTESEIKDELEKANTKRMAAFKSMTNSINAARKLGVKDSLIRESLNLANINHADIAAMMSGNFTPYKEQDIAFKNALDNMRQEAVSKEKFREIERRYRQRLQMLRKVINESGRGAMKQSMKDVMGDVNKLASNDSFMRFIAGTGELNKRNKIVYQNALNGVA